MRPTLGLAIIAKNEEKNLPRLLESVKDCFDKIYVTDTGSTDKTVEIAEQYGCEIHHFEWVNDFSAARNASFKPVTTDYVMWLDCDDVLENKRSFIEWRDRSMELCNFLLATYHAATDWTTNTPTCSYARERVFRTRDQFQWKYFIHEGVSPTSGKNPAKIQYVTSWAVRHMKTDEDRKRDRNRNLSMFASRINELDGRMTYYYGKELVEMGYPAEACGQLVKAAANPDMEQHDRLMAIEYAALAYSTCSQWDKAIEMCQQGIHLEPNRAEYWVTMGDCMLKNNQLAQAISVYNAAKSCLNMQTPYQGMAGFIHENKAAYGLYPRNQLARIWAQLGDFNKALKEAEECLALYNNYETQAIIVEIKKHLSKTTVGNKSID